MVSELAGEGAMPPQLPAPASRSLETVELRFHHRKQIRRGSLLRRGVNVTKTIALFSPSFNRSRSVKFLSKVLNNPLFEVVYRSESVKSSSRVLDPPSIAIVSSWSRVLVTHLILSLLVDSQFAVFNPTSWSRSVKRSSAELVNPLFDSVCVQSLSVNPLFIASRSRSVERTSTSLDYQPRVCAVEIAQSVSFIFVCVSRSRRGEQPVLDSDSENGEGSPKDSNTRFLAVFNPSRVLVNAVFAVLDRDSWSRSGENTTAPENGEGSNAKTLDRVFEEEFSENDPPPPPQPKFAVKKHLRSKLPWRIRIHFSPVLCSLFIERFALVWLDTTKLLSDVYCRLMCMLLNLYNQTNHPECKSHPDSGLSAIAKLDPGYIIAQLSSVWKEWIKWCIEFGVDAHAITAVQYDWRLQPSKLEERDLYFHKLKLTFETALKHRGGPSIVFAHSLGNNVFRYFLEWLKLEVAPKMYNQWLDNHIHAYFAVGSPFLGSSEAVKATLSGVTFGLPISEGTARLMSNSFGSSLWMMPFSKYCRADTVYSRHFSGRSRKGHVFHCDEHEFQVNHSGWPTNIVNIEIPVNKGYEAYPSFPEIPQTNSSGRECGLPTVLSFSAREVADGKFFKAIEDYDPDSERLLHMLKNSYHRDPVLNPLTPWERPPLKNIFCIYGIELKTEVGYYFAPSGKPYPDNWIITDVIYEAEGSLHSRSGNLIEGNPSAASGDETVPYHSLSWCKNWLGPRVNVTRAPQSEHNGKDVQMHMNVEHQHGEDIITNMTRSKKVKYITYFEDSESLPGRRTAVWELDKANHRNIVRSPVLMRELWLEMWHDSQPDKKSQFVTKEKRGPLRDADCYWDYGKARCAWSEHCEYRYVFGDVHLGQSCRLRNTSADLLLHYV